MTDELPRLTAEQTAERLGVKLETLYAYVARGRLARHKTARGSEFDALEVERFAASRRQRSAAAPAELRGHSDGRPLMVIDTGFAFIADGELYYRGREATALAASASFETVAHWALTGVWDAGAAFVVGGDAVNAARRVADGLPPAGTDRDRQQVAVTAFAALDPLRYSLDPASVVPAAEALVAGMAEVLRTRAPAAAAGVYRDDAKAGTASIAERLWVRLSDRPPAPQDLRLLNAALVLLIDHDIAVSTLAARAAASARANPYAVVTAGLGALDSPLHGNASRAAYRMLERVVSGEHPERVIADTMVAGRGPVPGFGQPLYRGIDPRARLLLGMLGDDPAASSVAEAVERLAAPIVARTGAHPNVDLALAGLALASVMPDDAGEVIFATARAVGWIVHALDEYAQTPLRLRPVGRYRG
ncbi:citrate synthase [Leifsonia poae]|uniref:citrate synthase (unknown stereospecificity) n=1 Tax=Leifsonia poae TaxID=110933 RepID=A0A9W6H967_9MICO|nr:citrate synthase [Leifsonia poae]GLJ75744.1 citrate synthase [Leifsonia poae]